MGRSRVSRRGHPRRGTASCKSPGGESGSYAPNDAGQGAPHHRLAGKEDRFLGPSKIRGYGPLGRSTGLTGLAPGWLHRKGAQVRITAGWRLVRVRNAGVTGRCCDRKKARTWETSTEEAFSCARSPMTATDRYAVKRSRHAGETPPAMLRSRPGRERVFVQPRSNQGAL